MPSQAPSTLLALSSVLLLSTGGLPARTPQIPESLFETCDWRLVGPFRGGRVGAVAGVPGRNDVYWFGASGGGVWKSEDGGKTWSCKSDGSFGGSIGAVAVAPSDSDVIWVGCGEETWRGNVSSGDGVYRSADGGEHWEFRGLPDSRHVSRIRIHPKDANLVYAAVMGHAFGPSEQRGVFRTKDGGKSWERILFANDLAGAVDLAFDPGDPNVLYASTWRAIRRPYAFESGGEGSGLFKSVDGGDHWTELSRNPGMPKGTLGIIGVAPSPAKPGRVFAMVEAEDGGLFRSDDAGATWKRVNDSAELRQRAWYYTRCYADPKDADTVYVLNVGLHRSKDGGSTFERIRATHGDHHDLWIDPRNPSRMIEGNDGGASVTTDGGSTWTPLDNQPTAQFYRVATDRSAPYRIYGAQQDNSAIRIRSRSRGKGIGAEDWESTAGGESGWLAPSPADPEIVYGGSYGGFLQRRDHRAGLSRTVSIWPDDPMGAGAAGLRYRFQWNFPVLFSPHSDGRLYAAANVLFATENEGQTWTAISPDLTRDDKRKQQSSGGPITQDNTSVEYYCTIFAVAESPKSPGVIWCGSDDGLVHLTTDAGGHWENVTPPDLPEWAQINCIEPHPTNPMGCYVAATRYKLDDYRPYVFATEDGGRHWRLAVNGLDPHWFARCVRADPLRPGLLFAGTERGVCVSFDDGRHWQRLQRNLPIVPVTDLCVHEDDLIAATQGRSFWVFDHLAHLRGLSADLAEEPVLLFDQEPFTQGGGSDEEVPGRGRNPASVPVVRFWLRGEQGASSSEDVTIEILDFDGTLVRTFSTRFPEKEDPTGGGRRGPAKGGRPGGRGDEDPDPEVHLAVHGGVNAVRFEPRYPGVRRIEGMVLWSGDPGGPRPAPGKWSVKLIAGGTEQQKDLVIRKDPRTPASEQDLRERFHFAAACRDALNAAHEAILSIRSLRQQMEGVVARAPRGAKDALEAQRKRIAARLTAVEEALCQTKSKSPQDPLNYPIRLNDKLASVMSAVNRAEYGPTDSQRAVRAELCAAIERQLADYRAILAEDIAAFNELALESKVPHVAPPPAGAAGG